MKRLILVLLAVVILPQGGRAQEGGTYKLAFCARDNTLVGHAFVVWGKEDDVAKASSQAAFGFYPEGGSKTVFGTVPGTIAAEGFTESVKFISDRLIVTVDKKSWDDTAKLREQWKTSDYNLFEKNCIHFTEAVAVKAGLKVPETKALEKPAAFMKRLIELNKK